MCGRDQEVGREAADGLVFLRGQDDRGRALAVAALAGELDVVLGAVRLEQTLVQLAEERLVAALRLVERRSCHVTVRHVPPTSAPGRSTVDRRAWSPQRT